MNTNPDVRTLYILKQGHRQKCRSCLKRYLGVQLLLCICVFSDVSRLFCSIEKPPPAPPGPDKRGTVVAAGGPMCMFVYVEKCFMSYLFFLLMVMMMMMMMAP